MFFEDILNIDIAQKNQLHRSFTKHDLGEGDNNANRFGVRITENGTPLNITGSCVGYFVRPDGITLVLDGTVSGNIAYVDLPPAAYAVEGKFTLSIKVGETGTAKTVRIVDGNVNETTTGTISDPSQVIPDLEELTEIVERAEAAADTIAGLSITAAAITGTRYRITVTKEE